MDLVLGAESSNFLESAKHTDNLVVLALESRTLSQSPCPDPAPTPLRLPLHDLALAQSPRRGFLTCDDRPYLGVPGLTGPTPQADRRVAAV